ncbi:MAG: hypothetical protein VW999_09110 [Alphaproteobacteria bacterium]
MTISYHIDPEKELVEVVFNGLFTVVQLIRLARDIIDVRRSTPNSTSWPIVPRHGSAG